MGVKLKNPPIVEAACEFRFSDAFEDLTVYGLLHEKLKDKFEKKKMRTNLEIVLEKANGKMVPKSVERNLQQFLDKDEKSVVQVGPQVLVVSKLKPYESWEKFVPDIEIVFRSFLEITELREIMRIGLRYINRINYKESEIDLNEYFVFKPNVPESIGKYVDSFIVGSQFPRKDGKDMLKITLTNTEPEDNHKIAHLLDIDYFTSDSANINIEYALKWVKEAHDSVEEAFFQCITDKLVEKFNK